MGMFENYQNLNTQYTPNNYQDVFGENCENDSLQASSPNKPYEILDATGKNVVGYFWYQGNSVILSFDVFGEGTFDNDVFVDVSDILQGCDATLTIYNDRKHNIVYQKTVSLDGNTTVDFDLTGEVSNKMSIGKYTARLVITGENGYCETVFTEDNGYFEVR